jgi:hypothetical protein
MAALVDQSKDDDDLDDEHGDGREDPAPPAAPVVITGKTWLNHELVTDPAKAAKLRKGKPPDVDIEITTSDNPTSLDDIKEDIDEREAIQQEEFDMNGWIESLPLHDKLSGSCLKTFYDDAIAWYQLQKAHAAWKRAVATYTKRRKRQGPYCHAVRRSASIDPPKEWILCSQPDKGGGCGGEGVTPLGICQVCYGAGFRVNTHEMK